MIPNNIICQVILGMRKCVEMSSSVPVSVVPFANPTVAGVASPSTSVVASASMLEEENFYRMLQSFPNHNTVRLKAESFV